MSDLLTGLGEYVYHAEDDTFADSEPDLPPLVRPEAHGIIRRLARYEDEKAALKANYEALVRELDGKRDRVLAVEGERLQAWTAAQLALGRKRSVRTLYGIAGFRTQPARLVVTDEAAALAWARAFEPKTISERFNVKALGKPEDWQTVDVTLGEIGYETPPGVAVVASEERFYVRSGAKAGGEAEE